MTREERLATVQSMDNVRLLNAYVFYIQNFNPVDDEAVFNHDIVKDEILRRMKEGYNE